MPESELAVRRLLARIGKKLRKMAGVVQPLHYRSELSAMADTIRDALAKPPAKNKEIP